MSEPCEHEREGALPEIVIGYVCQHGHYCFKADPEEAGQCGGKRTGTILVRSDIPQDDRGWGSIGEDVNLADAHLEEVITTWRDQ